MDGALFAGLFAKERLIEGFRAGMRAGFLGDEIARQVQAKSEVAGQTRWASRDVVKGWSLRLDVGQLEGETTYLPPSSVCEHGEHAADS